MNTVAALSIKHNWQLRKLQDNLPQLSDALGFDAFEHAQFASVLSACLKKALGDSDVCSLSIAVDDAELTVVLHCSTSISPFAAMQQFFDKVKVTRDEEDSQLTLSRTLRATNQSCSEKQIAELRTLFTQKSREELMEEIQNKNLELEATVAQRTEELHAALESANSANKAKSSFLAAMSHEIRTPMNGVVGMIDLLRQTSLDSDQQQMTNTVRDSAFSLLQIINDILDFSKIEAGKMDLEEIPFKVSQTLEGVVDTLAPNAEKKGITLLPYVDPQIPEMVSGDPVRLRQILFNIAGNAIKFTDSTDAKPGTVIIRADLSEQSRSDTAVIRYSIEDNGIGISKEAQVSLFEPFTQAESSTTRRFGGTGLGLSICVKLCDLMHGNIGVESEPGKGSNFIVTLPHQTVALTEGENREDDALLQGKSFFIATGIATMRAFLVNYLAHQHAEVDFIDDASVTSIVAALSQAAMPDVIVLGPDIEEAQKVYIRGTLRELPSSASTVFVFMRDGAREGARLAEPDTVTVDAQPLKRSTFVAAAAIAVGSESPDTQADAAPTPVSTRKAMSVEEARARGELILVAEDNVTNQDVIRRQLNQLGYAVELTGDGVDAFEAWKSNQYALLLTDCNMPRMDGFELTQQIRAQESGTERFPIIAITANALEGEAERCLDAGMDDYLSKPIDLQKLETLLARWMPASDSAPATVAAASPAISRDEAQLSSHEGQESAALPVDDKALRALVGDDDATIVEILKDFVSPATDNVDEITAAFNAESMQNVAESAHKLKSSARSIGAHRLADTCEALEAAGKSQDREKIAAHFPELAPVFKAVVAHIKAL
jgi:signal transduction histidine kinase/CheY-like chemotaxis protein/HPt (histidine-containing phosphotransfer) domain-containing protein